MNVHLRRHSAQPLARTGAAVELGHDHGVADGHQEDRDEEHHDVDEEVVDLLGHLHLDHGARLQVTLGSDGEVLVTGDRSCDSGEALNIVNSYQISSKHNNTRVHIQSTCVKSVHLSGFILFKSLFVFR